MSTTEVVKDLRNSRVGKRPVVLPKGVTATLNAATGVINIKGGKGELSRKLPPNVVVTVDAAGITVVPTIGGRDGARFQGLTRALINGMVIGTSEGFTKTMELKGTGYRAELKGQILNLSLGLSHPVNFPLPQGLKVEIPADSKGTVIILTCSNKEVLGQAAATIRGFRPPSPYGGKGVRFRGEKVREKAGKAAGGKGK